MAKPDDALGNLRETVRIATKRDGGPTSGERHSSASFLGADTEPPVSVRNPPRGKGGQARTQDASRRIPDDKTRVKAPRRK